MFDNQLAQYLVELPKKIVENGKILNNKDVVQKIPFQCKFNLISKEEDDYLFLWEIKQSKKKTLKLTLHFQEDESKIGLLRIDFLGQHLNPLKIKDTLPEKFHPYAGKWFDANEPHIHYYVEGYDPLDWAIPLEVDEFPIKALNNQNLIESVIQFGRKINLKTELKIYSGILL